MITRDPFLTRLLSEIANSDTKRRKKAASELRMEYAEQALSPLCGLLSDEFPDVRARAAKELGKMRDQSVVPTLLQMFDQTDLQGQFAITKALGDLRDEAAIPRLIAFAVENLTQYRSSRWTM
jgi:HEAT repeat protein